MGCEGGQSVEKMPTAIASQVEKQFAHLPPAEQLILLERLVEQFRVGPSGKRGLNEKPPDASGLSPDLQGEVDRFAAEFRAAQSDRLNEVW